MMMKSLSEYRAEGRAILAGQWGASALFVFVYMIIACVVNMVFTAPFGDNEVLSSLGNICATLLSLPFGYAIVVSFLRLKRGEELQLGWFFSGFNARVWLTLILKSCYELLWVLLLIVPGIIKSYSYAMTEYILHDDPELKNNAAIEKSMAMMDGHKLDLFLLDLSFIGWYLLCIPTLFIGFFWVAPYHYAARVAFYEDLKADWVETEAQQVEE